MCGFLSLPVSVRGLKVGVWSQTSGAGTPHSVQRRLQVAAPPQHGSRDREKGDKRDRDGRQDAQEQRAGGRRVCE